MRFEALTEGHQLAGITARIMRTKKWIVSS